MQSSLILTSSCHWIKVFDTGSPPSIAQFINEYKRQDVTLMLSIWEVIPTCSTYGKCMKTIPCIDQSFVKSGRQNSLEATDRCASMKSCHWDHRFEHTDILQTADYARLGTLFQKVINVCPVLLQYKSQVISVGVEQTYVTEQVSARRINQLPQHTGVLGKQATVHYISMCVEYFQGKGNHGSPQLPVVSCSRQYLYYITSLSLSDTCSYIYLHKLAKQVTHPFF